MPDGAIFADIQAEPASVYKWLDWLETQLPFPLYRVTKGSLSEAALDLRERAERAEAEVERLRSTMRSFIDFMDENLGTTADWPMEAAFDDEETCQRHCDHLNAMKRIVKPEGIN
jgi:hypothetical protein